MSRRERVEIAAVRAMRELHRACDRFPAMHSPHEAIAVIREEYLELEREVYSDQGRSEAAMVEAIQLAAMALRYVLDLSAAT